MKVAMVERKPYREATEVHSRLVKCPLVLEESRAYWQHTARFNNVPASKEVFEQYWFGAKSLPWVKVLLLNLRTRFSAFPDSLMVLQCWTDMTPDTRTAVCHWHLQLTDPLYRAFTADFLVSRRESALPEIHGSTVASWIKENGRSNWTLATNKKLATRLLAVACSVGLITGQRDPRTPVFPRVSDEALTYIIYLLRLVEFSGSLLKNPYLGSVGLTGSMLEARLRKLASLRFQRVADVVEFNWRHPTLGAWAEAELSNYREAQ